jgi:biopolymer transport protein ExbD
MPKVKVPRKSTTVDMTAMTDVAFLLLTFFMLATKFKPDEPVIVDTPSSVSEVKLPETDVMLLTIDNMGRVFFTVDGQNTRADLLEKMAVKYNITFTPEQKQEFLVMSSFGAPIAQLPKYLNMSSDEKKDYDRISSGIPYDSLNNELGDWVWQTRLANNNVRVAIKGDRDVPYEKVKRVIATLQEKKVNRFNFITAMEKSLDD